MYRRPFTYWARIKKNPFPKDTWEYHAFVFMFPDRVKPQSTVIFEVKTKEK